MLHSSQRHLDVDVHADRLRAWQAFVEVQTEEQFYAAWLRVLCTNNPDILAAAVLMRAPHEDTFVPVALWPIVPRDLSFLGDIAGQALKDRVGVVKVCEATSTKAAYSHAAIPILDAAGAHGAVVLELSSDTESGAQQVLRHVHWALGWLFELLGRQRFADASRRLYRIESISEVLAVSLRKVPLYQSLMDVVNEATRHLRGSRSAIGLIKHGHVKPVAISDAAHFERNTDLMAHYRAAMQEVLDGMESIVFSADDTESRSAVLHPAHAQLTRFSGSPHLLSAPLLLSGKPVGALIVERESTDPFEASEVEWFSTLATMLPSVIDLKKTAQRGIAAHSLGASRLLIERLFGPRNLVWKTAAVVIAMVFALAFVPINYRVTAKTVIEGEVQRSMVAPFESYVVASHVRAGDIVKSGQVLCEFDDRQLRLEKEKWQGEREQHSRELRQAIALADLSNVQIYDAQLRQAEAQLRLAEQQLEKAKLQAPFDGVVISGDLSQLIGSPVEQGKKLFEVAPLDNYRVILEVDESEISRVMSKQQGGLLVSGVTNTPLHFVVSTVTPVATAKDGRNYFRVEAKLDRAVPTLRPGMEGVGKIEVGKRRLGWVLTHSFTDWLRLWLWRWLP